MASSLAWSLKVMLAVSALSLGASSARGEIDPPLAGVPLGTHFKFKASVDASSDQDAWPNLQPTVRKMHVGIPGSEVGDWWEDIRVGCVVRQSALGEVPAISAETRTTLRALEKVEIKFHDSAKFTGQADRLTLALENGKRVVVDCFDVMQKKEDHRWGGDLLWTEYWFQPKAASLAMAKQVFELSED